MNRYAWLAMVILLGGCKTREPGADPGTPLGGNEPVTAAVPPSPAVAPAGPATALPSTVKKKLPKPLHAPGSKSKKHHRYSDAKPVPGQTH